MVLFIEHHPYENSQLLCITRVHWLVTLKWKPGAPVYVPLQLSHSIHRQFTEPPHHRISTKLDSGNSGQKLCFIFMVPPPLIGEHFFVCARICTTLNDASVDVFLLRWWREQRLFFLEISFLLFYLLLTVVTSCGKVLGEIAVKCVPCCNFYWLQGHKSHTHMFT